MISVSLSALRRRLTRFVHDRDGVSAVEFALLLPIMIALYMGTVEITQGLSIDRRVTLAARVSADLVTQASSVDTTGLDGVFQAAQSMITPYSTGPLRITITELYVNKQGQVSIVWSRGFNGAGKETQPSLPTGLVVNDTYVIWGKAEYDYRSLVGYFIKATETITLSDQIYMRPRLSDRVDCATCT